LVGLWVMTSSSRVVAREAEVLMEGERASAIAEALWVVATMVADST